MNALTVVVQVADSILRWRVTLFRQRQPRVVRGQVVCVTVQRHSRFESVLRGGSIDRGVPGDDVSNPFTVLRGPDLDPTG